MKAISARVLMWLSVRFMWGRELNVPDSSPYRASIPPASMDTAVVYL